jgi:hypothetical protein
MSLIITILPYLILASLAAVVVTLLVGVGGMAKGGSFNARNGNRLMILRVGFQALTIVLIVVYYFLSSS